MAYCKERGKAFFFQPLSFHINQGIIHESIFLLHMGDFHTVCFACKWYCPLEEDKAAETFLIKRAKHGHRKECQKVIMLTDVWCFTYNGESYFPP